MATSTSKPDIELTDSLGGIGVSAWSPPNGGAAENNSSDDPNQRPLQQNALQALLAFSALHDQIRRRKALSAKSNSFDSRISDPEFDQSELFVLDEVLQLVAERAVSITGADGLAIALAENNEIVLRAAAGTVRPDRGTRIDRDSAFSGACFRAAQVIVCDDTEVDSRVNLETCRKIGARSMVAVPLCGRRRVIGVLEAFSTWPFGFNDSDVRNLSLLAELVIAALKPEDEERFAESAQVAATDLDAAKPAAPTVAKVVPTTNVVPAPPVVQGAVAPAAELSTAKPSAPTSPATLAPTAAVPAAAAKPTAPTTEVKAAVPSPAQRTAETVPVKPAPLTPKLEIEILPVGSSKPGADSRKDKAAPVVAAKPTPKPAPEIPSTGQPKSEAVAKPEAVPQTREATTKSLEPTLSFGLLEPESVSRRGWILVLLVCIVVGVAFSVGVWWKLKTQQLGSAIVHTEEKPLQPVTPAPVRVEPASPNAGSTGATDSDSVAVTNESPASPATPQELAKFPRVTGVRHWSSADSSTVVLDLEDQVQYEPGHITKPERFYFDLRDTQLVPELQGKSFDGDALLSRIRVAQPVAGMTRVVLEVKNGANLSQPQVSLERDPYRLVIKVSKAGANPQGAVNLFPNAPETQKKFAFVVPPPTKEDLQLRARVAKMRIVVDAGHGGWDLGTVGRRGLLEKDLVLEISQRLGKLLESRLGADVVYTRPDDNYVTLDDRAVIANQAQADLFISVHANYSDLPSARGVETYYTNFFSAPGSNEVKNLETRSLAANLKNVASPTLSAADLHGRIEQSRRLAASVQRSLYGMLSLQNPGLRDRGVREAAFVVLTESAMPGVLAEVSFVSSPTDEQRLRSDGYREQIAEALYKGIARYAAVSHAVKVASAAK